MGEEKTLEEPPLNAPAVEKPRRQTRATTRRKAEAFVRSASLVKHEAKQTEQVSVEQVEDIAKRYSLLPSSVLTGIIGGVVGSAGGIAIGTHAVLGAGMLVVTGPLGLALGAAIAILAFRGRNYWRLENSSAKTKGALDVLTSQLAMLPTDAPEDIKAKVYEKYGRVLDEFSRIAEESIDQGEGRDFRAQRQIEDAQGKLSQLLEVDKTSNTPETPQISGSSPNATQRDDP